MTLAELHGDLAAWTFVGQSLERGDHRFIRRLVRLSRRRVLDRGLQPEDGLHHLVRRISRPSAETPGTGLAEPLIEAVVGSKDAVRSACAAQAAAWNLRCEPRDRRFARG